MSYLVIFLLPFFLSILFVGLCKAISSKLKIFQTKEKISFLGGLGIYLAFMTALLFFTYYYRIPIPYHFFYIIVFALFIFAVELIDDVVDLSLTVKFLTQVILIALYLYFGKKIEIYFFPPIINYIISFLWITGITNAFNLIDIGDGLCASVSLAAALAFLVIAFIKGNFFIFYIFLMLIAALIPFLVVNLPKAKIYMGNCGSHFLGFLFATLSIYSDYANKVDPLAVILPLLILAFPIIDTFFVIVARIKKGLVPFKKSNDHIFLLLLLQGLGIKKTLAYIYGISIFWGLSAVMFAWRSNLLFMISLGVAVVLTLRIILQAWRYDH